MYKKSILSLMVMLLFVATSCNSEEPAAIEPGGTISGDAGKTLSLIHISEPTRH